MKIRERNLNSFWEVIFFSNFFMGLMSLGLNFETNIKLGLPLNSISYYITVFSTTVLFYLFAYRIPKKVKSSSNQRTNFYLKNTVLIKIFKIILWGLNLIFGSILIFHSLPHILHLSWIHYFILLITFVLACNYYTWKFGFSLRRFTWLKPIIIAWTWAITTVYLPLLFLDNYSNYFFDPKFYFLFTQTLMYFIVNAIMFDMKDFEDDTNKGLKTFAVKYGIKFMLNCVILPLILFGFLSFLLFGYYYHLPWHRTLLMLIPILFMALFAYQLNQPKSILYYLIAIDGMILVKAIFGILSVLLFD